MDCNIVLNIGYIACTTLPPILLCPCLQMKHHELEGQPTPKLILNVNLIPMEKNWLQWSNSKSYQIRGI